MIAASYLANKPVGWPFAALIIAATLLTVALVLSGWSRDLWRSAVAAAFLLVVLAFLA